MRSVPPQILQASVEGLSKILANHTNATGIVLPAQNVTIKLSMQMSESGILSVSGATATLPSGKAADSTLTGRLAGLFGGKKDKAAEEAGADGAATGKDEPADGSFEAEEAKLKEALENKPKDANETVIQDAVYPLTVITKYFGVEPMSTAEKIESGKL